jgi:hypothetical protein
MSKKRQNGQKNGLKWCKIVENRRKSLKNIAKRLKNGSKLLFLGQKRAHYLNWRPRQWHWRHLEAPGTQILRQWHGEWQWLGGSGRIR